MQIRSEGGVKLLTDRQTNKQMTTILVGGGNNYSNYDFIFIGVAAFLL